MRTSFGFGILIAALIAATAAHASAVIDLNFEGINATYPSGNAFINDFYNGGRAATERRARIMGSSSRQTRRRSA